MARIRSIHPGLFTDEAFASLSFAARLLLMGIWTEADDKGCFEWKPLQLKMRLFPADNVDVPVLLDELTSQDVVMSYEIDGRKYGAVRNFRKFQKPKKPNDIHPSTEQVRHYVHLKPAEGEPGSGPVRNQFGTSTEKSRQMEDGGGRREEPPSVEGGAGGTAVPPPAPVKPTASKSKRGTRLPDDWKLPKDWGDWAVAEEGLTESEARRQAALFADHWRSQPGAKGVKLDWLATWRNWIRRRHEFSRGPPVSQQASALDRI